MKYFAFLFIFHSSFLLSFILFIVLLFCPSQTHPLSRQSLVEGGEEFLSGFEHAIIDGVVGTVNEIALLNTPKILIVIYMHNIIIVICSLAEYKCFISILSINQNI